MDNGQADPKQTSMRISKTQAREACSPYYEVCPTIVQEVMARFAERTGRHYRLVDYHGHPQAERVVVVMGSAAQTAVETVDYLVEQGEHVGVVTVRLFRPFSPSHLFAVLPETVRAIAVLDRTKEPGRAARAHESKACPGEDQTHRVAAR